MNNRFIQISLIRFKSTTDRELIDQEYRSDMYYFSNENGLVVYPDYVRSTYEIRGETVVERLILPPSMISKFTLGTDNDGESGKLVVKNLSKSTAEFLSADADTAMVEIDAGYDDHHGIIWSGSVAMITRERQENGDIDTEFVLSSFDYLFSSAVVSISRSGKSDVYMLVSEILDRWRIPYDGLDSLWTDAFVEDYTYSGKLKGFITDILSNVQGYFHGWNDDGSPNIVIQSVKMDQGENFAHGDIIETRNERFPYVEAKFKMYMGVVVFYIDTKTGMTVNAPNEFGKTATPYRAGSIYDQTLERVIDVNARTGLIETPTTDMQSTTKLKFKHRLVPNINVGVFVRIELSDRNQDTGHSGIYQVTDIKHKGSNDSGAHIIVAEAKEVDLRFLRDG